MTLLTDALRRLRPEDGARTGSETMTAMARWWPTIALAGAGALALALRVRMMTIGRSFWLDEAALALNICGRSFGELLKPLDHDQGAPIGFLFLEKASTLAFGPTEFALRLFPFLASIASLILIHRLCSRAMGRWAGVVAVAIAGVMPALFYYSGELKQYSSDIASGLLILVLAQDVLESGLTRGRAALLTAVGVAVVWFSHPSVFVLAGAGSTLIVRALLDRQPKVALALAAISAAWLASFAVEYVLFLKALQSNDFLADYWEAGFLNFPPRSAKDLRVYPAIAFGLCEALFYNGQADVDVSMRMSVFMGAAWLIGAITLYRQGNRQLLVLLLAPLAFAVVASMLHKYPLKQRLALFTAGSTLPVIVAGVSGLLASRDALNRTIGGVVLGGSMLLPTMQGAQFLVERPRLHDARSILARLSEEWRPGDVVVVDKFSALPLKFYREVGKLEGLDRIEATPTGRSLNEPDELAEELKRWAGRPRVWFLFDTTLPDPTDLSRQSLVVLLDQAGTKVESFACRRYTAMLYRFDRPEMVKPAE